MKRLEAFHRDDYLIKTHLGNTGYVRDHDAEFSLKGIKRSILVDQLHDLKKIINSTLHSISPEQLEDEYPIPFDDDNRPISYVLVQLLAHLNYHLGQIKLSKKGYGVRSDSGIIFTVTL